MSSKNIQEKLEQIRLSYISSLAEKKDAIDTHWRSLKGNWNETVQDDIYLIIHGIAGSAETFGLPELTQQARTVIDLFKLVDPSSPDASLGQNIDDEIDGLLKKLTNCK